MKKRHAGLIILFTSCLVANAQPKTTSDQVVNQVVEGGKVLVELIKVFSTDKKKNEETGCKGRHADLCITNERDTSLTALISHRGSDEIRELVIVYGGSECSLQLPVGVWTYDLRLTASMRSIRKGDLLIEECNNVTMSIK